MAGIPSPVSDHERGPNLTERRLLVATGRARVRADCSRERDSVILWWPLTSQVLMGHTLGPKPTAEGLADVHGGGWGVCCSPDWPSTLQAASQTG